MIPPSLLVFDVIDTLLDNRKTHVAISKLLHDQDHLAELWFTTMLQYSLVDSLCSSFHPFLSIGKAAFDMVAKSHKISYHPDDLDEALLLMLHAPAHPDVELGLKELKSLGIPIIALTNSSHNAIEQMLSNAGIITYFDGLLTVDDVRVYKPHIRTYELATRLWKTDPKATMLVAAHGWDITGANHAGWLTTFISREGQALYPLDTPPTFLIDKLDVLPKLIVE